MSNIPEFSVSELSSLTKNLLEENFSLIRVRGEITNVKSKGHCYFTLKDADFVLNAVCWSSKVPYLNFKPEEGLEVICSGKISTGYNPGRYPGRSNYQITIDSMKPAGLGALMAILEERKQKLKIEGLFEEIHKKTLPKYPTSIGVITSPTGAVLQDIKHRISDRFPCNIILWPVPVQGNDAAELIENAILGFNTLDESKIQKPDVIILARGGGSIEDLWCFNEEEVVRAVFQSQIPVISAIGHETDTTLVDYASDMRAPTPTAAAELATPAKDILLAELSENSNRLNSSMKNIVSMSRERVVSVQKLLPSYQNLFNLKLNEINILAQRLPTAIKIYLQNEITNLQTSSSKLNLKILKEKIKNSQNSLSSLKNQLTNNSKTNLSTQSNRVLSVSKLLESLSYKSVIKRGFSVVRNSSNIILTKKTDVLNDKKLNVETKFGTINVTVDNE